MLRKNPKIKSRINSEKDFKKLFEEYYRPLFIYAKSLLKNENEANDIVQECFYNLWKNRTTLEIKSISGFLYTDVRHKCLNFFKHQKIKEKYISFEESRADESIDSMLPFYEQELMRRVSNLIEQLPKQQKESLIYRMSGDSIPEISEKMGISMNTVRTHLKKARKFLRSQLKNTLFIIFLIKYSNFFNF